ncbi:MAG: hypothetical protein KDA99_03465 [Planctomycetales bacterium]|nr:hypothetical protein [Planctomycetales bacterium]
MGTKRDTDTQRLAHARSFAATLFAMLLLALNSGCQPGSTSTAAGETGAFPPTISDTDYHGRSWTRSDCLVCHEAGVQNAPKIKHTSVPPLAREAKCRTCHVQILGQVPPGYIAPVGESGESVSDGTAAAGDSGEKSTEAASP